MYHILWIYDHLEPLKNLHEKKKLRIKSINALQEPILNKVIIQ